MYPSTAAVRQGCTRGVVLSSCCLVHVICGVGNLSDTKHYPWYERKTLPDTAFVDVNVRMVFCINYYEEVPVLPPKLARFMDMLWTCARSGSTAKMWGMVR